MCGGAGSVANSAKPVIWFNRQPSNSTTSELDMDALTFNDKTYYVGFDAGVDTNLQFVFSGIIILSAVTIDCLKYVQKK